LLLLIHELLAWFAGVCPPGSGIKAKRFTEANEGNEEFAGRALESRLLLLRFLRFLLLIFVPWFRAKAVPIRGIRVVRGQLARYRRKAPKSSKNVMRRGRMVAIVVRCDGR
jgi:hypothetical protein